MELWLIYLVLFTLHSPAVLFLFSPFVNSDCVLRRILKGITADSRTSFEDPETILARRIDGAFCTVMSYFGALISIDLIFILFVDLILPDSYDTLTNMCGYLITCITCLIVFCHWSSFCRKSTIPGHFTMVYLRYVCFTYFWFMLLTVVFEKISALNITYLVCFYLAVGVEAKNIYSKQIKLSKKIVSKRNAVDMINKAIQQEGSIQWKLKCEVIGNHPGKYHCTGIMT